MAADLEALRARTAASRECLRGTPSETELGQARDLVAELCKERQFALAADLGEAAARHGPRHGPTRCLHAQALIELGHATAAIDMLQALSSHLDDGDPWRAEASGLLGRAFKQIFIEARDKAGATARAALKQSVLHYRKPFEEDPTHAWHGINLVAMLTQARQLGLRVAPDLDPQAIARSIAAQVESLPDGRRTHWDLATLAEARLALADWPAMESALRGYVTDERTTAFAVGSTLRQFTQVWAIESLDARGQALADILRARLLALGGALELAPQDVRQLRERAHAEPMPGQLEAVLGSLGVKTWKWWKAGLDRAGAVCSVRTRMGDRMGTGWLVRAGALNRTPADELLVVTNFHVVNEHGMFNGIPPGEAQVVFETVRPEQAFAVQEILWSSPPDKLDCALLRLAEPVTGIEPLPVARALPTLDNAPRVYVIGHAGGRDLAFSMQDNELLDHEGPPAGKAALEGVCRVHYRAPTEGGSSGSPVFNASSWEVIALHHSGGKLGTPMLNGKPGTYPANEGIWMQSIIKAMG